MKAAILTEINKPLTVADIEPTALGIGQVLVRVLMSGLCGAQLQEIAGLKNNAKFVPHLLGHEGCGYVEDIGPGVTKVKVGNKVILHWKVSTGIESNFPQYIYNNKLIYSGKVTTLSQYSIVSENRMTVVPNNISNEFCTLLGCGLSTGLGIINYDANIKFGESVLILGCGGVGLSLILGAKLASAATVIGLDITEDKRLWVEDLGGQYINSARDYVDISNIDCIIDTTGNLELVSKYLNKLTSRGRCIIVSQPNVKNVLTISDSFKFFSGEGQIIRATQGGNINPAEDFPRYINMYTNLMVNFNKLITHYIKLDEINSAIDLLRSSHAGRIMITTE